MKKKKGKAVKKGKKIKKKKSEVNNVYSQAYHAARGQALQAGHDDDEAKAMHEGYIHHHPKGQPHTTKIAC